MAAMTLAHCLIRHLSYNCYRDWTPEGWARALAGDFVCLDESVFKWLVCLLFLCSFAHIMYQY